MGSLRTTGEDRRAAKTSQNVDCNGICADFGGLCQAGLPEAGNCDPVRRTGLKSWKRRLHQAISRPERRAWLAH